MASYPTIVEANRLKVSLSKFASLLKSSVSSIIVVLNNCKMPSIEDEESMQLIGDLDIDQDSEGSISE
jgi:hypothetical protein